MENFAFLIAVPLAYMRSQALNSSSRVWSSFLHWVIGGAFLVLAVIARSRANRIDFLTRFEGFCSSDPSAPRATVPCSINDYATRSANLYGIDTAIFGAMQGVSYAALYIAVLWVLTKFLQPMPHTETAPRKLDGV